MKTYEDLQKEWNESTYGNEFAHYVYSIDKETIERLKEALDGVIKALEMEHDNLTKPKRSLHLRQKMNLAKKVLNPDN